MVCLARHDEERVLGPTRKIAVQTAGNVKKFPHVSVTDTFAAYRGAISYPASRRPVMSRRPLVLLVIVLSLAATWWWNSRNPASVTIAAQASASVESSPGRSAPALVASISPPTAPSRALATPLVKPAVTTPAPDQSSTTPVELTSTLSGLKEQIQSNDFGAIFDNYADPVSLAQMRSNGHALEDSFVTYHNQPNLDIWIQVLQSMKDQTPQFNTAGDVATYQVTDPTGRGIAIQPITLHKINGQWYFSITGILKGAAGYGLTNNPPGGM